MIRGLYLRTRCSKLEKATALIETLKAKISKLEKDLAESQRSLIAKPKGLMGLVQNNPNLIG
jgi:hypothetical protein